MSTLTAEQMEAEKCRIDAEMDHKDQNILNPSKPTIVEVIEHEEPKAYYPATVTEADVRATFKDTGFDPLVKAYEAMTTPALPLPIALPKALINYGCGFSGKKSIEDIRNMVKMPTENQKDLQDVFQSEADKRYGTKSESETIERDVDCEDPDFGFSGNDLARIRIKTGLGQVANVYSLIVAPASSGKNHGDLDIIIAKRMHWFVGTQSSASGFLDQLINIPNGYLRIGEMQEWFNVKSWEYSMKKVVTDIFNQGHFKVALSTRNNVAPRETNYCYPNILGLIQPQIFLNTVAQCDADSGFLARNLIFHTDDKTWRDARTDIDSLKLQSKIIKVLKRIESKKGDVEVPQDYLKHLKIPLENPNLDSHWRRLVNEYGPRFACFYAIPDVDWNDGSKIILTKEHWDKAEILIRYCFQNAASLITNIGNNDVKIIRLEGIRKRLMDIISECTDPHGLGKKELQQKCLSYKDSTGHKMSPEELIKQLQGLLTIESIEAVKIDGDKIIPLKQSPYQMANDRGVRYRLPR